MKTKTTNPRLKSLIKELKQRKGVWKDLGEELDSSNKRRAEVNLYKLNKELEEDEIGLVPGKILGYGEINHPIKTAALNYSGKANEKIKNQDGKPRRIEELLEKDPEKDKIRIIK